jgi:hypothetical protein
MDQASRKPPLPLVRAALAAALLALGCGGSDSDPAPGCADDHKINGVCVGVSVEPICEEAICTAGVSCSSVTEVRDAGSLSSALSTTKSGACIALHAGSYGDVALPGGVSLLGRAADDVKFKTITVSGGKGSTLRGLAAVSVLIEAGAGAKLDSVRISGSSGTGVEVGAGSSLTLSNSEVLGSALYGVRATDPGEVTLSSSIVSGSAGPGVWVSCTGGCACASKPSLTMERVIARDNKVVGLSLSGTSGTLTSILIEGNQPSDDFAPGHGVSVSACSSVKASGLAVRDNVGFGLLVDDAGAELGEAGEDGALEVSGNQTGVWLQNVGKSDPAASVTIDNASIKQNLGIGLGVGGASRGIICWRSAIEGTKLTAVPVLEDGLLGSDQVGDGIVWTAGSSAELDGITLSDNQRASLLIDGDVGAGSRIANVSQSGADAGKGILQQGSSGVSPSIGAGAPPVTTTSDRQFSVAIPPAAPQAL